MNFTVLTVFLCVAVLAITTAWPDTAAADPKIQASPRMAAPQRQPDEVEYFLNQPITMSNDRENLPWGEAWTCAKLFEKHGRKYISFWNVRTRFSRWLTIAPVILNKRPSGDFEFRFRDGDYNEGIGHVEFIGKDQIRIEIEATKKSKDLLSRIVLSQYGTYTLPRAACPYVRFIDGAT